MNDLKALRTLGQHHSPGTRSTGSPPGVEVTTGPLGQGHRQRRGHGHGRPPASAALFRSGRRAGPPARSTTMCTASCPTGDIEEGISHEVSSLAAPPGTRQPDRPVRRQPDLHRGQTPTSPSPKTYAARYEAYGWARAEGGLGSGRGGGYHEDVDAPVPGRSQAGQGAHRGAVVHRRCGTIIGWPRPRTRQGNRRGPRRPHSACPR